MLIDDFELYGEWKPSDVQLVGLVAEDKLGRFLMQLRDDFDEIMGRGRWGLFGGHVDAGESLIDCAKRESFEELGLTLKDEDLEPLLRYNTRTHGYQMYVCRIKHEINGKDIRLGEGAGFAFLTRAQVMEYDLAPNIRDFAHSYVLSVK